MRDRSYMRAGCQPRLIALPCRTATSSITIRSSSRRAADGVSCSRGMNDANGMARRYHWLASELKSFVNEPHVAVCSEAEAPTLNLVATESEGARQASAVLAREKPVVVLDALRGLPLLSMPRRHAVLLADVNPQHLDKILLKTNERPRISRRCSACKASGPKRCVTWHWPRK